MALFGTIQMCANKWPLAHLKALSTKFGGARGVVVIVVGNGHGDMSSNPGRDWLHFK